MYDIVGDVHGYANELRQLMTHMGYPLNGKDLSAHPQGRRPVFIGDYVDRGPDCRQVIEWIRAMTDDGHADAVMGNHEYNAVLWATPDPRRPGEFVRRHSERNHKQHAVFLNQMSADPAFYASAIDWFKSLPLYLVRGDYRFVHACWHQQSIDLLQKHDCMTVDGRLTEKGWAAGGDKGSPLREAIDILLKGPEEKLGKDKIYVDVEGTTRTLARVAWWKENPATFGEAFSGLPKGLSFASLPYDKSAAHPLCEEIKENLRKLSPDARIFIGHLWEQGEPTPLSHQVACVDYSIAQRGRLTAYRTVAGETDLKPQNFFRAPNP